MALASHCFFISTASFLFHALRTARFFRGGFPLKGLFTSGGVMWDGASPAVCHTRVGTVRGARGERAGRSGRLVLRPVPDHPAPGFAGLAWAPDPGLGSIFREAWRRG